MQAGKSANPARILCKQEHVRLPTLTIFTQRHKINACLLRYVAPRVSLKIQDFDILGRVGMCDGMAKKNNASMNSMHACHLGFRDLWNLPGYQIPSLNHLHAVSNLG